MTEALRLRRDLVWLVPVALAGAVLARQVLTNLPGLTGDTVELVHGARAIIHCLDHGIHSYCDRTSPWAYGGRRSHLLAAAPGVVIDGVGPYALYQYLPAILFTQLGMSNHSTYVALTVLSLVSFCALVTLCAWVASRAGRLWAAPLTALALLTAPLLWYAGSTLGEGLAALLGALLAAAALRRWPPAVLGLCAALACITKETIPPVIALLGAVSLWATPIGVRALRRAHWIGLAAGVFGGVLLTVAFNWFRYHQLTNFEYTQSFLAVPGTGRRLGLSVALWVSPNGGLALYWPLAAVAAIGAMAIVTVSLRRRPVRWQESLPAAAVLVSLIYITGTLASWWASFGWQAWGPRLSLPPLPAVILIMIVMYADAIERGIRWLLARPVLAAVPVAGILAFGLAQVNVFNAGGVASGLFNTDSACPRPWDRLSDPPYYYHCVDHIAWAKHWALPATFSALDLPVGRIYAVAFVVVWASLIALMAWPPRSASRARRDLTATTI